MRDKTEEEIAELCTWRDAKFVFETRVIFMSAEDATASGYDACRMCFR